MRFSESGNIVSILYFRIHIISSKFKNIPNLLHSQTPLTGMNISAGYLFHGVKVL